jgi:hypothetical protein
MSNAIPKHRLVYVPHTPAGTACVWLEAKTEEKAWENLLRDAAHMPYKTKENFIKHGYTVEAWKS